MELADVLDPTRWGEATRLMGCRDCRDWMGWGHRGEEIPGSLPQEVFRSPHKHLPCPSFSPLAMNREAEQPGFHAPDLPEVGR